MASALQWMIRATGRAAWAVRKVGYYFFPPVIYDSLRFPLKMLAPRIFQRFERERFLAGWKQRFDPPPPRVELPAPPGLSIAPLAGYALALYQNIYAAMEDTPAAIEQKLYHCRRTAGELRVDRIRLLREIARLERAVGQDVKAALYYVRAMRLIGADTFDDMPWVRDTLNKNGYQPEADAAFALYARGIDNQAEIDKLLDAAEAKWKNPPPLPDEYTIYDDRRGDASTRLSVVMTLYNGANKLAGFLQALQLQTLNRRRQMELVIVDSCSPTDEYAAFRQAALTFPIPTLFVRTKDRETIQTAWNRGIRLARGPYVSLLGVDETNVPVALQTLADALDADPSADWAVGDILTTEVTPTGLHDRDLMPYDRRGFADHLIYLDTTYLGPVAGAHRKAMHDRIGWFDGGYRAAGDTEFKNRVLPHIKVVHVPLMLGVYLNYPEERTTQSPRAEFEDLRAWYLHRSVPGMRRAFRDRPTADLERLLLDCLGHRKAYLKYRSTDFRLADVIATLLAERGTPSPLAADVATVLAAYRALDDLPTAKQDGWYRAVAAAEQAVLDVQARHRGGPLPDCEYAVFNDNTHEQHQTFW